MHIHNEMKIVMLYFIFVAIYLLFPNGFIESAINAAVAASNHINLYRNRHGLHSHVASSTHVQLDPNFLLLCDFTNEKQLLSQINSPCNNFWLPKIAGSKNHIKIDTNTIVHASDIIQNGEARKWQFKINNFGTEISKGSGIRFGLFCTDIDSNNANLNIYTNNNAEYYRGVNHNSINDKKAWYLLGHGDDNAWLKWHQYGSVQTKQLNGLRYDTKGEGNGDTITIMVDLIGFKIQYYVNGVTDDQLQFDHVYSQCKNGYRLSIESRWHGDSLSLLKYWKQTELGVTPMINAVSNALDHFIDQGEQVLLLIEKMSKNKVLTDIDLLNNLVETLDAFDEMKQEYIVNKWNDITQDELQVCMF